MAELDRLVAEVAKSTDHIDILFANAGATWGEKFDTHPEKMFSKVMDLNVKSVFYTIQKYVSLEFKIMAAILIKQIHATPHSQGY